MANGSTRHPDEILLMCKLKVLQMTAHKMRQIANQKVLPVSDISNEWKPPSKQYKLLLHHHRNHSLENTFSSLLGLCAGPCEKQ